MKNHVEGSSLAGVVKCLQASVKYIYGICLLIVLGVCLFCSHVEYSYKKDMDYANWVYMLLGAAVIGLLFAFLFLLQKKGVSILHGKRWMAGVSVLFFFGLVFWTYHYYFKTGWDAQAVEGAAHMIALGDFETAQNMYFSYYPNNVFLTFVFSMVIKLGYMAGISNYYFCIIVFQCFLFAAAGFLVYCAAEKILNPVWAIGIWGLYAALAGMSPWVVIPYSDATGMIFPIFIFYLYLCIRERKHVKSNLVLLTFFSYVGYHIKPQIMIVTIAIAIIAMLEFFGLSVRERRQWLKKIVWPIVGFAAGFAVVTAGVKATGLEIDKERAFGMSHFLMMGVNYDVNGVINLEDQNFSMGIVSAEERTSANLEVAAERVREMGIPGLLKLGVKKILTTFSDGTFAWWEEGEFYTQEMYDGIYSLRGLLSGLYYEHGANFQIFVNCMQTLWMGVLVFACAAFVKAGRKIEESVMMLAIVGLFLFELIFEVRARYLFTYAPFFVILAGSGIYRLKEMTAQKRQKGVI